VEKKLAMGAAAVIVLMASMTLRTPTYEASRMLWVDEGQQGTREGFQVIVLEVSEAATSRPVAEDTIERLGLKISEAEALSNLKSEQIDNTNFIRLSYTATDPAQAKQIVSTAAQVSAELSTAHMRPPLKVTVVPRRTNGN
jgi:capsular polysaccharide biosynthesis protein